MTLRDFELIVVGAGPAGLTAGMFGARLGMRTLVLAPEGPGGALLSVTRLEDIPGHPQGIAGYELGPLLHEQAAAAGAQFEMDAVSQVRRDGDHWAVVCDGSQYEAPTVIVATGTQPRHLAHPDDDAFKGRGVSYCASCDGPLHRTRSVAVVGGGDSGLLEALELVQHVGHVTVVERRETLPAQETYRRRVEGSDSIAIRCHTVAEQVIGDQVVTGLLTRDTQTDTSEELQVSGVFVYVGREPQTSILNGMLELDLDQRVPADNSMRTALPGLFVAGDVRADACGQAVAAAGDGATAARSAFRCVRGRVR
jgi:thioredoxin reductase (NADPH)